MEKVNIRVFDAGKYAVYQHLDTGLVELVGNTCSVVASATPKRPANYNKIVGRIESYSHSYIAGTRNIIVEHGVEIPAMV